MDWSESVTIDGQEYSVWGSGVDGGFSDDNGLKQ